MRRVLPIILLLLIIVVSCANMNQKADGSVMRMSVTDGKHTVIFRLNDSNPAKSLYDMLPLDVEIGDFLYNEKIFYPPQKVDASDGIVGGGDAGDLALFSPWGDIVMYVGPFESHPGLFLLGTAEKGAELIRNLSGTIHVDKVR